MYSEDLLDSDELERNRTSPKKGSVSSSADDDGMKRKANGFFDTKCTIEIDGHVNVVDDSVSSKRGRRGKSELKERDLDCGGEGQRQGSVSVDANARGRRRGTAELLPNAAETDASPSAISSQQSPSTLLVGRRERRRTEGSDVASVPSNSDPLLAHIDIGEFSMERFKADVAQVALCTAV